MRLLTRVGITKSEVIHRALIRAVLDKDHALVEHLIKSGGDPNFRSCESVVKATEQADIESLILVTRSKVSHTVFFAAFAAKSTSIDRWQSKPDLLHNIDKILLEGGAAGPAVD